MCQVKLPKIYWGLKRKGSFSKHPFLFFGALNLLNIQDRPVTPSCFRPPWKVFRKNFTTPLRSQCWDEFPPSARFAGKILAMQSTNNLYVTDPYGSHGYLGSFWSFRCLENKKHRFFLHMLNWVTSFASGRIHKESPRKTNYHKFRDVKGEFLHEKLYIYTPLGNLSHKKAWKRKKKRKFGASLLQAKPLSTNKAEMGVEPKNRGKTPKMDGENNGKPYEQMDDLGG